MELALANSSWRVCIDEDRCDAVLAHLPWSRVGSRVMSHLLVSGDVAEGDQAVQPRLLLEQVVLGLSASCFDNGLWRVMHANGDVRDYRRANLRVEAMPLATNLPRGVHATLCAQTWLVVLRDCTRRKTTLVGVGRDKSEAEQLHALALATRQVRASLLVPRALHEAGSEKAAKLVCWREDHTHDQAPLSAITRDDRGTAALCIRDSLGQCHMARVDDCTYRRVEKIDWRWVAGTIFHPQRSLVRMIYEHGVSSAADLIHINGDLTDFRRTNLALRSVLLGAPAPLSVRHQHHAEPDAFFVCVENAERAEDGWYVHARKGVARLESGPYEHREVALWAALQTSRQLFGNSPPTTQPSCDILAEAKAIVEAEPPTGWTWQYGRALFVGDHYDTAEEVIAIDESGEPLDPRMMVSYRGVRACVDETAEPDAAPTMFEAFYDRHLKGGTVEQVSLGTYDCAWVAAWVHDCAVMADRVHLRESLSPTPINGVPRPVGFLFCVQQQRGLIDLEWLARQLGVNESVWKTCPIAKITRAKRPWCSTLVTNGLTTTAQ